MEYIKEYIDKMSEDFEEVFEVSYYKKQLSKYQNIAPKQIGNVRLTYKDCEGFLGGYLYKGYISQDKIPGLFIGESLWMSITPMEVESHYLPIKKACGKVGVAGLGLGYYVQEILEKDNVESIDVYEINQDVIDMYIENFGLDDRVNIINQDVLTMKNKEYDFFYADIYKGILDSEAIKHKALIKANNAIDKYFIWTQEGMALALFKKGIVEESLVDCEIRAFILALMRKKGMLVDSEIAEFAEDILEELEEVKKIKEGYLRL